MNNLIRSELYKIKKSKVIILSIIFTIFISMYFIDELNKKSHISNYVLNVKYSIGYSFQCCIFESLIFLFIAAKFIVGDFRNKTLNHGVLVYGYSRSKVLLSKLISFILICLFCEMIFIFLINGYVAINYGIHDIGNIESLMFLFRVISVGLIYSISLMCIIYCVAVLVRNTIALLLIPLIGVISWIVCFNNMDTIIFKILACLPYISGMWGLEKHSTTLDIVFSLMSTIATIVITVAVSLFFFKRQDIK